MLINFSVKNFRSIKDKITLSFEATSDHTLEEYFIIEPRPGLRILKMGIIYGANASGKTNILRALDFLRDLIKKPHEQKDQKLNFSPFKFDKETVAQPTEFELEFYHNDKKYIYFLELNQTAILYEKLEASEGKRYLVFERTTNTEKELSQIKFGSKIKLPKAQKEVLNAYTLWNNTVLGAFKKTNIDLPELKDVADWFDYVLGKTIYPDSYLEQFLFDQINNNPKVKKLLTQLANYADLSISDFKTRTEEFSSEQHSSTNLKERYINVLYTHEKGYLDLLFLSHKVESNEYELNFYDESAGTQRYLGFAAILLDTLINQKILVIDELEASLHPDLIKHFILTFIVNSRNAQLIATTHFRELLQEKDILRPDIIWFTERKQDQSTDLYSLADFDSSVIRKTSSYYNAYKIGKLGAVPNLRSYYLDLDAN